MLRKLPLHLMAVLTFGAVSQIAQILFMRELLMVFHGNELSIGLILSAWLLWVGLGSHLGAFITQRVDRTRFLLVASSVGVLVLLPSTIVLIREARRLLDVFPGAYLSLRDMIVSCFLLVAPAGLVFGAQFVFLSKLWRELIHTEDTRGAEKTYIWEAAGTMLGGLVFTFLMIQYFSPLQGAVLASVAMLLSVLVYIRGEGRRIRRVSGLSPWIVVVMIVVAYVMWPVLEQVDDWAYRRQWEQFAPGHGLVEQEQSKYGIIVVAERQDQYSFFQSGHLIFSTAGQETAVPGFEQAEAVDFAHLAMVQHPQPERVLLIGGGLRGVLSEVLRYPVQRVDYIELDEVLTKLASRYVPEQTRMALEDPRVNLVHADGRLFVKTIARQYDLIILDKPDPFTAELNRYYTEEFFREVQELLPADGVFITQLASTPSLRGLAIANRNATLYHTLRSVFSNVLPAGERTIFFIASEGEGISVNASVLEDRFRERSLAVEAFSPRRYHTLLEPTQLQRINWAVRTHGRRPEAHLRGIGVIPPFPGSVAEQELMEADLPPVDRSYFINTDFRPIGYFYTLMFWENLTRAHRTYSLQRLLRIEWWWIGPLVLFPLLFALALAKSAKKDAKRRLFAFAVKFTVFTTGLSTMSLQIALLFSFQSVYGFVYEMVGLITAIFMGGLAVGAWVTHKHISDKVNILTLAWVQLFMAFFAIMIAIVLPEAATIRFPTIVFALFSMLTFIGGLINGIDFPLAISCYNVIHRQAEKSTSTVYGMELLGACTGAIVASVVVAPIFGIAACCLLAAIASGAAALVLWISKGVEAYV